MEQKIAVIAGNKREFDYFNEQCFPREKFVYVSSPDKIRGARFTGYIKFGTYYDRKDIHEMLEVLEYNII